MEKRRNYEAPSMEVVELEMQGSLLAGSSVDGNSIEDANLKNFEDWD